MISFHSPLLLRDNCLSDLSANMQVIYPEDYTRIIIPRELDGSLGKAVFEIAYRNPEKSIFWHLDQEYLGSTKNKHRMEIDSNPGVHQMTLVNEQGESISWTFEILAN